MLSKQELRKLDIKKLSEEILKTTKELFETKFKVETGQSKEINKVDNLKRYIARAKTIQHQKKQIEEKDPETPALTEEKEENKV